MEEHAPIPETPIPSDPPASGVVLAARIRSNVTEMARLAADLALRLDRAEAWIRLKGYCPECLLPLPAKWWSRSQVAAYPMAVCQHPPEAKK